jgi:hypothetical protein
MILNSDDPGYLQCAVTVMDNVADPDFAIDENGICNYFYEYERISNEVLLPDKSREEALTLLVDTIKREGRGKPYDCITGVSGGIDSSFLIHEAKRWGLRPLIVHFDNGWNSEIAVHNIDKIISKTGYDLYTIVVNWEEFRDLQLSYFKAGVVDLEVPTDHAIAAVWYKLAEAIMPKTWNFNKTDYVNLSNIHRKFGKGKFKTYPIYGFKEQYFDALLGGVKYLKPLNLTDFNKEQAKATIKSDFGWVDYGGKHYESVFTKFYQAFILPQKFKIDKRKAHLSNLILSGQITRSQALAELNKPLYDSNELDVEMEYVLKKLGMSKKELETYISKPGVPHLAYGKQQFITDQFPFLKLIRPIFRLFKTK